MHTLRHEFDVIFKSVNFISSNFEYYEFVSGYKMYFDIKHHYGMLRIYRAKIEGYIDCLYNNKLITYSSKYRYIKLLDNLEDRKSKKIHSFRGNTKLKV